METALRLVAGIVLVGLNAFFVAIEFALTRLRQFDESEMASSPALQRAWAMTERLEIHLTGCQLGISATSILLGVVTEPAVTSLLSPIFGALGLSTAAGRTTSVVVAVVLMNLIHKIWGEQAPTYIGVERPLEVARRLAPVLYWWSRIMAPVIRLGDGLAKLTLRPFGVEITRSWVGDEDGGEAIVSYGEVRRRMGHLLARGRLPEDRRREVLRSLEISRIPVRDVLVPRDEMVTLDARAPWPENLETMRTAQHDRYALRDGQGEGFAGILYAPVVLAHLDELEAGEIELADLADPAPTVDAGLPVAELIDQLQDARSEVALVTEGGRVAGMVTVTDAFETIAGEMEDPRD